MDAGILVVGDELLTGHTRDTNGGWIARELTHLGHRVRALRVVADDDLAIERDLHDLLDAVDLVVVTGGLGPTHDDHTTAAVADAFDLTTAADESALERLRARYARFYRGDPPDDVLAAGRKMVTVPEGARVLPNPAGAAVGYALDTGRGLVVVLPGVPREVQAIWTEHVAGDVVPASTPLAEAVVEVELPEASFGAQLARVAAEHREVSIGSYPRTDRPAGLVRIRGEDAAVERARRAVEAVFREHLTE